VDPYRLPPPSQSQGPHHTPAPVKLQKAGKGENCLPLLGCGTHTPPCTPPDSLGPPPPAASKPVQGKSEAVT
jgi:hypothetical protein